MVLGGVRALQPQARNRVPRVLKVYSAMFGDESFLAWGVGVVGFRVWGLGFSAECSF